MAGGKSTGNAARGRKRVEATVLKRSKDGSAFTRCEACNKDVPVVLIDMHSCSLDSKIKMMLEAEVVEKIVEVPKPDRKRSSAPAKGGRAKADKDSKRKRTPTAFFVFMADFRKDFKAANPDIKGVSVVGKEAGEKWKSMTDEEKKPYFDKAAELKAQAENAEGSGENNVGGKEEQPKEKADDKDGEQEVDQPPKRRRIKVADEEEEAGDQEDEDEENELDDDLDDDM